MNAVLVEQAMSAAERKRDWIISREGDANGERREEYYLTELFLEELQKQYIKLQYKEKASRQPARTPNPYKFDSTISHFSPESKGGF